jgi:hypothetical protein
VQLRADAAFVNAWLKANPDLPAGHLVSLDAARAVHPSLGMIEYPWRGSLMRRASAPQGLWHFELAAGEARGLIGPARRRLDGLLQRLGGQEMMQMRLVRPLVRQDYVLVLGQTVNGI